MDVLLAALSRDPRALWWRAAAVAAACVVLGSVLLLRAERAPVAPAVPCRGAERKLAGVWDEDRRERVTSAFASTKTSYGASAAREVTRVFDVYVRRWLTMHTAACEATRVHGEQSEELMDLRIACLDDQLRDLRALSDLFAKADDETVQKAVQAAYGLHGLEACADITTLQARVRPPDERVRAEVLRLREGVSRASALDGAGKYAAAEDAAESLLQAARATRYAPIEAEVEYWVGRARTQRGKDMAGGIASLYASVDAAEAGRDDVAKARALVQLTFTLGEKQARYDEAERAGRLASAVLTRLPSEIELRGKVDDNLGFIAVARGRYAEGVTRSERALKLREEAFGPDDYRVAVSLSNTSKSLYRMGRTEQALAYQQRAASILARALGESHPLYALALGNMAITELSARLDEDALRDATRALTIWSDALGRDHRNLVQAEGVVASILTDLGRFAEALPHAERSLALAEAVLPPDHPNTVSALNTVGKVQLGLGRTNDAVAAQERALAMCKRTSTPPYETAETLSDLGEAYLVAGRPAAARPLLEQAVSLRAAQETDPLELAESRLLLARALGTSKRATELAEQARDAYATSPRSAPERAAAEAWLAAHR